MVDDENGDFAVWGIGFDKATDAAEFVEVAIYERAALPPGAVIPGPAVIIEDETPTVVSRAFEARIDDWGYIELTRRNP